MMVRKLNEKGQLTLDFLFAVMLICGVCALLGALTFTLTLTEVVQYVTFSAARTYLAADMAPSDQSKEGNLKGTTLLQKLPFLTGAVVSGWIKVQPRGAQDYTQ